MKRLFTVAAVLMVATVAFTLWGTTIPVRKENRVPDSDDITSKRLEVHSKAALEFVEKHREYNDSIVFLIDMTLPIRKHRFFVYDLRNQTVLDKGLVAHGEGSEQGQGALVFSNTENSHCTSLGKYAVGKSYHGKFGKSYKLHGLDPSNNNAFNRAIVLHSYEEMSTSENTDPVFLSLGCPMVSPVFFNRLEDIIDASDRKILMEIYY